MIQPPQFKEQQYKIFEIANPGAGGLNLEDLEFNLLSNQSPDMLNRMIRNGSFGKRYGQDWCSPAIGTNIVALGYYKGKNLLHSGTNLYRFDRTTQVADHLLSGLSETPGEFINFNKNIYYLNGVDYLTYDGSTAKRVEAYIPDVVINRKPDGSYSDLIDNYNRYGSGFKNTFNGDGESTVYILTQKGLDSTPVKVEVGGTTVSNFSVDAAEGKITFTAAPAKGQNNVVITAYKTDREYIDSILHCKYMAAYGGENNSRLFLAGNGSSIYYYSDVFDASYFPESNYASVGNGENDITGFGEQYDTLIVFKPTEMYGVKYVYNSDGKVNFNGKSINGRMGCDTPYSIQMIDNRLTWISTVYGACTLVSTAIEDERNVQVLSRNVNGGYRKSGLLQENNLTKARTINHDGKYWIYVNGKVYLWDYTSSPYKYSGNPDFDGLKLAWFLFDKFQINDFVIDEKDLIHARGNRLVELNNDFTDFGEPINSTYQTPMLEFGLPDTLKTVKRAYIEVRADTPSKIKMRYITEENPVGEDESEDIVLYTRLWDQFQWDLFGWSIVNFAKTFTRKCSLKKIQMASIYFHNNENRRDMSISNIRLLYTPVKRIK